MRISILIFALLFSQFLFAQQQSAMPPIGEPGKCYAKCIILKGFEETQWICPIYTGNYSDDAKLDSVYFKIDYQDSSLIYYQPPTRVVNLFYQPDSPDVEKIVYVVDTLKNSNFQNETITYKKAMTIKEATKWQKVVCNNEVRKIIRPLQKALQKEGYLKDDWKITKELTTPLRNALVDFQMDNNLPIGQVNIQTLEELGINY